MDDAFEGMVEESNTILKLLKILLTIVEDFRSQKWKDHVFVGQKLEDYIEVKV